MEGNEYVTYKSGEVIERAYHAPVEPKDDDMSPPYLRCINSYI